MVFIPNSLDTFTFRSSQFNNQLKIRFGPAGILIFDRTTGMNILIDEFVPSIQKWAKAPRQVSIALTNACDLACEHCYAPKQAAILPFDRLTSWLFELDQNGCIGVSFGGGEPTLYPRLVELCEFVSINTNLSITITTHGHRLDDQLLDALSGTVHFVRISMDGIYSTYERMRKRSFKYLLERINATQSRIPFGINYLVNANTIGELDKAVDLVAKLGAAEFLLLPEVPIGKGRGLDSTTSNSFREWVINYQGKVPLCVSEYSMDGIPVCDPLKDETGVSAYAHIDANGELKRTSFEKSGIQIYGNRIIEAIQRV